MAFDVAQTLFKFGMKIIPLTIAHQTAPGAVPTVGGAPVRNQKKHPVRVAVNQPRHRHITILPTGIEQLLRRGGHLLNPGNDLTANRTIRIVPVNQVEKVWSDRQGQFLIGKITPLLLLRGQGHHLFQLFDPGPAGSSAARTSFSNPTPGCAPKVLGPHTKLIDFLDNP